MDARRVWATATHLGIFIVFHYVFGEVAQSPGGAGEGGVTCLMINAFCSAFVLALEIRPAVNIFQHANNTFKYRQRVLVVQTWSCKWVTTDQPQRLAST